MLRPASWLALLSRTFTFELSLAGSPQANVEYNYVDKQSIPTTGRSPASPTALWAAEQGLTPKKKKKKKKKKKNDARICSGNRNGKSNRSPTVFETFQLSCLGCNRYPRNGLQKRTRRSSPEKTVTCGNFYATGNELGQIIFGYRATVMSTVGPVVATSRR